jgi:hypothetical protein
VIGKPDLVVSEMSAKDGAHTVIVKNIGDVASPATVLRVDFCRPRDGAVVASAKAMVESLAVGQSVRINVHYAAMAPLQAIAYADATSAAAEKDETNNVRAIVAAGRPSLPAPKDIEVQAEPVAAPPPRT